MSGEGFRTLGSLVAICLALVALKILFSYMSDTIPAPSQAKTPGAQTPYIAVEKTGLFHKRLCPRVTEWRLPGIPVPKEGLGPLATYSTPRAAIEAGYRPCPACKP